MDIFNNDEQEIEPSFYPSFNESMSEDRRDYNIDKITCEESLIPCSPIDISSFMNWDSPRRVDATYEICQDLINDSDDVIEELPVEQIVKVGNEDPHGEIILADNTSKQDEVIDVGESSIETGTDPNGMEEDAPCRAYECAQCDSSYDSREARKIHVRSQHPKNEKSIAGKKSSDTKLYPCPSCSYSSQKRSDLDDHIENHVLFDGVHPCGKKRHNPEALPQRHRHNAEEYKCPHCPYVCTVYKAMTKHQKVHLEDDHPFTIELSCKICGEDRPTETKMQRHLKEHKIGDHFQCDLCPFTTMQLTKIIQHRRVHTGEKPHLCPRCDFCSARRDNMLSHVRRKHQRSKVFINTFNP